LKEGGGGGVEFCQGRDNGWLTTAADDARQAPPVRSGRSTQAKRLREYGKLTDRMPRQKAV